jgi:hypothetical protein
MFDRSCRSCEILAVTAAEKHRLLYHTSQFIMALPFLYRMSIFLSFVLGFEFTYVCSQDYPFCFHFSQNIHWPRFSLLGVMLLQIGLVNSNLIVWATVE